MSEALRIGGSLVGIVAGIAMALSGGNFENLWARYGLTFGGIGLTFFSALVLSNAGGPHDH